MSQKTRYLELSPKIKQDILNECQVAADHITHVGYLARPGLGVKWEHRALDLHRKIMQFHFLLEKEFVNEALAMAAGKGTRSPNGTRKELNFKQPLYRSDES